MIVYVDTETTGLNPHADELVLVGVVVDDDPPTALAHGEDGALIQAVLDLDAVFVGHNSNFDRHFLEVHGYRVPAPERWIDTQILAHVAGRDGERKAGNTSLARLTKRLIEAGQLPADVLEAKAELKVWLRRTRAAATRAGQPRPEKGHAPRRLLCRYLAADLICTRAVYDRYAINLNGQRRVLELEQRVAPAIYAAEARGVPIDVAEARQIPLRERAQAPGHARSLLRARGAAVQSRLEPAARAGAPRPRSRSEHTLYGTFRQVGAETGRMSSGEPNLQNIPKSDLRARYCVRAKPGNVLVGADLEGVGLRVLAAYAPGGALERDLATGEDPHQRVADRFGVERDVAKRFNFGVLYGAGMPRVAKILGISQEDAREALDVWYATYPEIAQLKADLSRQIRRRGYIETAGRRRHYAEQANHMTLNYLIQGSAADLFKAAIAELHRAGVPMILFVHDEIVCEASADTAEETARLLERALTRGNDRVGGLLATADVHERWSQFKDPEFIP